MLKLSQICNAAGIVGARTEQDVLTGLRRLTERANSIYQKSELAGDPNIKADVIIVVSRPGHWSGYQRGPDGTYRPCTGETTDLAGLEKELERRFGRKPSTDAVKRANERQQKISTLVNERMSKGFSYTDSFSFVRKSRLDLFASMVDPSERQRIAHTPKGR